MFDKEDQIHSEIDGAMWVSQSDQVTQEIHLKAIDLVNEICWREIEAQIHRCSTFLENSLFSEL